MAKGKLYIIPIPINDGELKEALPDVNLQITRRLRFFVVEKLKTRMKSKF